MRAFRAASSSGRRALTTAARIQHQRPVLPAAKTLEVGGNYTLNYLDITPPQGQSAKTPTFVFIHGAPGSFQDFKYLIPLLQDKARVIGINLPGNGDSKVLDRDNYYNLIKAQHVHRAAYDALTELCSPDEHVFVLGHSFGGHATINVAAFNEEERKLNIQGMALVASAGLRPHKAMQPRTNAIVWKMLRSNLTVLEMFARELIKQVYTKVLRFPNNAPTEHYVAGIVRCATTDFSEIKERVERVRHVPTFFAWARDDAFMEEEVFLELSDACHSGPRYAFTKGGHNIQKTKAPVLAKELWRWALGVMNGDPDARTQQVIEHP